MSERHCEVIAANDKHSIDDATFSVDHWGLGSGNYILYVEQNQYISVSAPGYQTAYVVNPGIIELTYVGAWPQTY